MRAFIAIDLPAEIHAELERQQLTLRRACRDARWTSSEGIHLTLKFLGEISETQVKGVVEALQGLGEIQTFPVEVRGFGFFPDARRPRVFWAGVDAPEALAVLAGRVEQVMEGLGFPREPRAFNPHLTLARFKVPKPQPELAALAENLKESRFGRFQVSEFFLYESTLSPRGATYRKMARFPAPAAA